MDILNEEEAMFESPLVDSYLNSPVTVSVNYLNATYTTQTKRGSHRAQVFFTLHFTFVTYPFLMSSLQVDKKCCACIVAGRSYY